MSLRKTHGISVATSRVTNMLCRGDRRDPSEISRTTPQCGFARLKRLSVIQVWRTPTGLLAFVQIVPSLIKCRTHDLSIISEELWYQCCLEWCSIRKYNFRSKAEWQQHSKTRFHPTSQVVRWLTDVYNSCTHNLYVFIRVKVTCPARILCAPCIQRLQQPTKK
jgi:hypothetical protein